MINFNPQRSKILPLYEFQFASRFLCPVWQKERRKEKEATRDTNKIHLRKERGTGNAASLIGPCRQPDKPHFRPIANKSLALFSSLSSSSPPLLSLLSPTRDVVEISRGNHRSTLACRKRGMTEFSSVVVIKELDTHSSADD